MLRSEAKYERALGAPKDEQLQVTKIDRMLARSKVKVKVKPQIRNTDYINKIQSELVNSQI